MDKCRMRFTGACKVPDMAQDEVTIEHFEDND